MSDYVDFIQALQPPPLQKKPRYLAFLASFGQRLDTDKGRLIEAIRVGLVDAAPVDALDLVGQDRLMPRYPSQDNDTYRAYLRKGMEVWGKSGTKESLEEAFTLALPGPVWTCKEFKFFPTDPLWDGSTYWSQFLMEAEPADPIEPWYWGDGSLWGEENLCWGLIISEDQKNLLLGVLAQWKAEYTHCAGVRFIFDDYEVVIFEDPQ